MVLLDVCVYIHFFSSERVMQSSLFAMAFTLPHFFSFSFCLCSFLSLEGGGGGGGDERDKLAKRLWLC